MTESKDILEQVHDIDVNKEPVQVHGIITQKEKYLLKKKTGKKVSESVAIAIRHFLDCNAEY